MGTVDGAAVPGVPGSASAAADPRTRIRSFRARPDQVREARQFLAQVLGDCPRATDALACLSELVTNSVLYSNSRRPEGRFIVRASLCPAGLRVEVEDEGGPWEHRPGHNDQRGRGLVIVDALSTDWSITGDGSSRTVWFEIGEAGPPAPEGH
jgi:anti-sigma regulatory factor (Ser/Thr protein kinase)